MGLVPRLVLKIILLVLVLTTFLLARFGYAGFPVSFGEGPDLLWLGCITTGPYLIIVPAVILAELATDDFPCKTDVLWTLACGILYIVLGSCTVEFHDTKLFCFPHLPRV
eukprot:TRINITY_DN13892_c0_g1_i1.p1 TRINITY_DN13892_c0_g1~~TRINITY_DN13892_c0_g1_i1.p1  ORF type:complete len:110 (-),score=11.10 TRINITY_DN13892_c0_g1_i1:421-750(-)